MPVAAGPSERKTKRRDPVPARDRLVIVIDTTSWKGCSGEREYGNDSVTCVRTGPVSAFEVEAGSSV